MLLYVNLHKVVSAVVWSAMVVVGFTYLALEKRKKSKAGKCGMRCSRA